MLKMIKNIIFSDVPKSFEKSMCKNISNMCLITPVIPNCSLDFHIQKGRIKKKKFDHLQLLKIAKMCMRPTHTLLSQMTLKVIKKNYI